MPVMCKGYYISYVLVCINFKNKIEELKNLFCCGSGLFSYFLKVVSVVGVGGGMHKELNDSVLESCRHSPSIECTARQKNLWFENNKTPSGRSNLENTFCFARHSNKSKPQHALSLPVRPLGRH